MCTHTYQGICTCTPCMCVQPARRCMSITHASTCSCICFACVVCDRCCGSHLHRSRIWPKVRCMRMIHAMHRLDGWHPRLFLPVMYALACYCDLLHISSFCVASCLLLSSGIEYYGVSSLLINLCSVVFMILYLPASILTSWLFERYGLRVGSVHEQGACLDHVGASWHGASASVLCASRHVVRLHVARLHESHVLMHTCICVTSMRMDASVHLIPQTCLHAHIRVCEHAHV